MLHAIERHVAGEMFAEHARDLGQVAWMDPRVPPVGRANLRITRAVAHAREPALVVVESGRDEIEIPNPDIAAEHRELEALFVAALLGDVALRADVTGDPTLVVVRTDVLTLDIHPRAVGP